MKEEVKTSILPEEFWKKIRQEGEAFRRKKISHYNAGWLLDWEKEIVERWGKLYGCSS